MYACDSFDHVMFDAGCIDGDIRLAGGSNMSEGRVEICVRGAWTTVCDQGWDEYAARVVCREIGFTHAGKLSKQGCIPL